MTKNGLPLTHTQVKIKVEEMTQEKIISFINEISRASWRKWLSAYASSANSKDTIGVGF